MYTQGYDEKTIRQDSNHFVNFVIPSLNKDVNLLDLGCGTCKKLIDIAANTSKSFGIDRNQNLLTYATRKIEAERITNIFLYRGDNLATPFSSETFDFCTASLTLWSAGEVHRVLNRHGVFFIELLTADDKLDIKKAFGKDELGWRGRFLNQTHSERMNYITKSLEPFFSIDEIKDVNYQTSLSRDGFIALLQQTPTIRNFSIVNDRNAVDSVINNGKVVFFEHRILIKATKREW